MLYYLTKAIIFIIRLLPRRIALPLFSAAGFVVGRFHTKERAIAAAQLNFVFARRDAKSCVSTAPQGAVPINITKIIDDNFRHIGKVFYESLIIDRLTELKPQYKEALSPSDQPYRHIHFLDDTKEMDQIMSSDTACFILSAHFGCFELLAACAAKFEVNHTKRQLYAVGRNPNFDFADRILKDIRSQYGVETIWRDDKKAGVQLVQTVKRKNWLAVLIDQDTNLQNIFCPFLGLDAAYPVAPISLAVKYSIPIVSAFIMRDSNNKHFVTARRIHYDPSSATVESDIINAYSAHLESILLKHPEQWVWWHRRWRRRPENNDLRGTSEYIEWLNSITES